MVNVWYAFVCFSIGLLAGFQGVYERFRADSLKATSSWFVIIYLLSRGAFASVVFEGISASTAFLSGHPVWRAVVCGAGAETILRSKIYFTRIQKGGGSYEEWSKGPLDLLRFYQDFFLTSAENRFVKSKISRVESVANNWKSFLAMYAVYEQKILGWPQDRSDVKETQKAAQNLRTRFDKDAGRSEDPVDATVDKKYRYELCYIIVSNLGMVALETIFRV